MVPLKRCGILARLRPWSQVSQSTPSRALICKMCGSQACTFDHTWRRFGPKKRHLEVSLLTCGLAFRLFVVGLDDDHVPERHSQVQPLTQLSSVRYHLWTCLEGNHQSFVPFYWNTLLETNLWNRFLPAILGLLQWRDLHETEFTLHWPGKSFPSPTLPELKIHPSSVLCMTLGHRLFNCKSKQLEIG